MHELAVTQSILEIAVRHAQQAGVKRVSDIFLVIGELSSVIDNSVQFYWDFVAKDTIAAGARLHFRRIETEMACQACGKQYKPEDTVMACPDCGSTDLRVAAGDEFYVEAIEVER